jgi:hypothetical protein
MPNLDSKTILVMRKIHRWGGLLLAAFIIFYCITGILLNHRKSFGYFSKKKRTIYNIHVYDLAPVNRMLEFYKGEIDRRDNPRVIRIRDGKTIELLYGTHGKVTYIIHPRKGIMEKVEKFPRQPLYWLNSLHKAFKTSSFWILLTDAVSAVIVVITVTGLIILRYRPADYILLAGGVIILFFGAMLS